MNFKSFGLKTAVATAVIVGSSIAISPAQAATFGSVSFGGFNGLTSVKSTSVDFTTGNFTINSGSGTFANYVGGTATIKDFATNATSILSFIKLAKTGFSDITFDLTAFLDPQYVEIGNELKTKPKSDNLGQFTARLSGFFQPGSVEADSAISALATIKQTANNDVTLITLKTAESIPTPALLPGLLALGASVLRKRKAEVAEEVQADA
jgi:hypothetical protein